MITSAQQSDSWDVMQKHALIGDDMHACGAQVERLSGLVQMGPERIEKVEDQLRLQVINSTININKRLVNLYELIENDLLGSLQFSVGYIAPYGVSHIHLTCFSLQALCYILA